MEEALRAMHRPRLVLSTFPVHMSSAPGLPHLEIPCSLPPAMLGPTCLGLLPSSCLGPLASFKNCVQGGEAADLPHSLPIQRPHGIVLEATIILAI